MFNRRPVIDILSIRWLPGLLLVALLAALLAGCAITPMTSTQQVAELTRLIRDNDLDGAVALIERYSGDLDDRRGLSVAVRVGNAEAVRFFAQRVGVDAPLDLDDTTALIDSITRAPPAARASVAQTLLELGADPHVEDKFGRSAESLAERRNERELLDMIGRYSPAPRSAPPSRMLSWLPDGKRSTTLLASSSISDAPANVRTAASTAAAEQVPAMSAFLTRSIWIPPGQTGNASLAAFRFHADGRGELLRYVPRDRRSSAVPDAQIAWEFEDGRLRFFVLSPEFSALCESAAVTARQIAITCTDYTRALPTNASNVSSADAAFDSARVLLQRPRVVATGVLRQAARSTSDLVAGLEPGCRPKATATQFGAGTLRPKAPAGDWYAINLTTREVFAPLSGMACRPAEAQRAAIQACMRTKGGCRAMAGCPAGQVSALASMPGRSGAWVGCDPDPRQARQKALDACKASAGCDCSLIAINGQNVNIARQPACGS